MNDPVDLPTRTRLIDYLLGTIFRLRMRLWWPLVVTMTTGTAGFSKRHSQRYVRLTDVLVLCAVLVVLALAVGIGVGLLI